MLEYRRLSEYDFKSAKHFYKQMKQPKLIFYIFWSNIIKQLSTEYVITHDKKFRNTSLVKVLETFDFKTDSI